MRAAFTAGASVGLFVLTLAFLLLEPRAGFFLALAAPLAVAILAFARIDSMPWIVVPTLAASTLWAFSAPGAYVVPAAGAILGWCLFGVALAVRVVVFRAPGSRYREAARGSGAPPPSQGFLSWPQPVSGRP